MRVCVCVFNLYVDIIQSDIFSELLFTYERNKNNKMNNRKFSSIKKVA